MKKLITVLLLFSLNSVLASTISIKNETGDPVNVTIFFSSCGDLSGKKINLVVQPHKNGSLSPLDENATRQVNVARCCIRKIEAIRKSNEQIGEFVPFRLSHFCGDVAVRIWAPTPQGPLRIEPIRF